MIVAMERSIAPSAFLQDFASKEWNKGRPNRGKRVKTPQVVPYFHNTHPSRRSTLVSGQAVHDSDHHAGAAPVPLSLVHLESLTSEERSLIVGGKLEACWSDLLTRLKSSLRVIAPKHTPTHPCCCVFIHPYPLSI
jgi:hypothetical protein